MRAAYFGVILLATYYGALARAHLANVYQDAQHFTLFEDAARISIARFHELPLWNPYYCGGITALGTPSARFVSPTFVFTLIFGVWRGAMVASVFMTYVGLEGTYRYARLCGAGSLAAMTSAPVFALSGIYAHAILVGWTNFFGFELLPWALVGARLACSGSTTGIALGAGALAGMVGFGGTYTAPLSVLAVAYEVAASIVRRPSRAGPAVRALLAMGLLATSVGMVRLWPLWETLRDSPRILGGSPGVPIPWVFRLLFGSGASRWARGELLIGLPILPLLVFGVTRRRAFPLVAAALLWTWFALGYSVTPSIFAILRGVPPYTMLRAPERFLVLVALPAATIVALGIRRLEAMSRSRPFALGAVLLFHTALHADTALLGYAVHDREAARTVEASPDVVDRDFRQTRGNRWLASYFPAMSRGSLSCFDDHDIAQSTELRGDLPAEEYLREPDAGSVTRTAWSPTRIDLHVALAKAARVYVNQNWHPGWRASAGAVVSANGLLAVDLPAGSRDLALVFRPRSALGGMATSFLGLVALVWVVRSGAGTSWQSVLLAGAPLLAIPLSLVVLREPPPAAVQRLTPGGEPMILAALPRGSTSIGARWQGGIELVGAALKILPGDATHGERALVELDWRFGETVPAGLGVLVAIEGGRTPVWLDHERLSGGLLLEDAPSGAVVRDVWEPIALPDGEHPFEVSVGVWRARRDSAPVKLEATGNATATADRVRIGALAP